jgi:hypothetical protein
LVEVCDVAGKNEVHAVAGQGLDTVVAIKRCPKAIAESAVGTRYKLAVKIAEDGGLSSYHGWPFELAA